MKKKYVFLYCIGGHNMDNEFKFLVAGLLKVDPDVLNENSTATSIPEWDSLNHWLVIGELESHYGVEFTMDEATKFKNLGDMYYTLKSKLI